MSTKAIFGKGTLIEGVGLISPIKLSKYDEFLQYSNVLYYSKNHFGEEFESHALLDLLILGLKEDQVVHSLISLFRIVIDENTDFYYEDENNYGFKINEGQYITKDNYDLVRSVIMRQNLMIEQKTYKSKIVQEWANKAMEAKSKNGVKMLFEDTVSTVSVYCGKHYSDLENYTIYQLQSDFNRIGKLIEYDTTISFKCAGDTKSPFNHYAEHIDFFKDPHDDLFIKENKLGQALS